MFNVKDVNGLGQVACGLATAMALGDKVKEGIDTPGRHGLGEL
jgi:hypothetical protein